MIFSIEAVAKMALRWSAVKAKPLATMVSCPGPPAIWNAVPISCTVNVVPVALVLTTAKPLTELCDRSSVASDVISWSFVPLPLKFATPLASVLLIFSVRFSPSPDRLLMWARVLVVRS